MTRQPQRSTAALASHSGSGPPFGALGTSMCIVKRRLIAGAFRTHLLTQQAGRWRLRSLKQQGFAQFEVAWPMRESSLELPVSLGLRVDESIQFPHAVTP